MTTTTPMACGNCGNGLFRISRGGDAAINGGTKLHAECASCGSTSIITTKPSALQIDWCEGSRGILCDMTPSMEQAPPPPPPAPRCQDLKHDWEPDGTTGGVKCTKCGESIPF